MNQKIKYWVSELKDTAQLELFELCKERLLNEGYEKPEIEIFLNDIMNEKLLNLEELITYEEMINFSK